MKRLLVLLLIAALTLVLFACTPDNGDEPNQTPTPTPEDEVVTFEPEAELVEALIKYLDDILTDYDMTSLTIEEKIDQIAAGKLPLLIEPSAEDRYYVCGYYGGTPDVVYSDAEEYTWVGFTTTAFPEEYEGEAYVLSFEISRARVTQLLDNGSDTIAFESFELYDATFTDGINLNTPSEANAPYILIDDRVYISVLKGESRDGEVTYTADVRYMFGEYYDRLNFDSLNIRDVTQEDGRTTHYYLVPFEVIAILVSEQ